MAAPNSVEVGLISELRKRFKAGELKDEQSSDSFLIRWIRARNQNVDKAEDMLRKSLKWRQDNDIDNILSWEAPNEIKELAPIRILGSDSDNLPILLVKLGKVAFQKIIKQGKQDIFAKYLDRQYENTIEQMKGKKKRDGTPVSQFIMISDLKGFSFKNLANSGVVELLNKFGKTLEANHPETLKKLYAINAGKIFPVILSICKPILAQSTRDKIVASNSSSKWKPILQQNIPLDVLPKVYGGNNTSLDFEGAEGDEDDNDDSDNELLALKVPQGEKAVLIFEVSENNSSIHWAFKTDKSSIDFVVNSVSEGNKIYVKETKLDSHVKLIEGSVKCGGAGDYEIIFSNANSSSEEQELQYRVDIRSSTGAKQLLFD